MANSPCNSCPEDAVLALLIRLMSSKVVLRAETGCSRERCDFDLFCFTTTHAVATLVCSCKPTKDKGRASTSIVLFIPEEPQCGKPCSGLAHSQILTAAQVKKLLFYNVYLHADRISPWEAYSRPRQGVFAWVAKHQDPKYSRVSRAVSSLEDMLV